MYIPFSTRLNGGYRYYGQYCKPRAKLQAEGVHDRSATFNFPTLHSLNHPEFKNKKKKIKTLIVNI